LAGVAVAAVIFIAGAVQNSNRKPDEYTLIFEGDNKEEVWADIEIQGEKALYNLIGSLELRGLKHLMGANLCRSVINSPVLKEV